MPFGRVSDVRWFPLSYPKDTLARPRLIYINQLVLSKESLTRNPKTKEKENLPPRGREDVGPETPFHPMRPACYETDSQLSRNPEGPYPLSRAS
jgi:hypothetical protein